MAGREEYGWAAERQRVEPPVPSWSAASHDLRPALRRRAARLHRAIRREVTWLLERNASAQAAAFAHAPGHDAEARQSLATLHGAVEGDLLGLRQVQRALLETQRQLDDRLQLVGHELIDLDGAALDEDLDRAAGRVGAFMGSVGSVAPVRRSPAVSVASDVGPLLLPAHDKVLLSAVRASGAWEPELGAWLRLNVQPGSCVLNVGAHVGYHVLLLARCVGPLGRVLAVEPETSVRRLLHANLWRNRVENVLVLPAAATQTEKPVVLTVSRDNTGDNRVGATEAAGARVVVPGLALDSLLEGAPQLDLVLSDLQGHDQAALRGARAALARLRPRVVAEFWPAALRSAGEDPAGVLREYESWGYQVQSLDGDLQNLPAGADLVDAVDRRPSRDTTLLLTPLG